MKAGGRDSPASHSLMDDTASERAKYTKVWNDPEYRVRSPGLRHLDDALAWMQPEPGANITDWGSGSGQAADAMVAKGYRVRMVDIATNAYRGANGPVIEACLWELPDDLGPTDYGFCADVMEHLPPERVDQVFAQIAARTARACYFQIALFRDCHFTHAGPLHLSVFRPPWWEKKILAAFGSAQMRTLGRKHLLVVARP